MNNPNPFVPKGSILEAQSKRRSRLKIAVFCSLAVGVAGLSTMLIQGCKRETPPETTENLPTIDTNTTPVLDTNTALTQISNTTPVFPPITNTPSLSQNPPTGSDYIILKGDNLSSIAKSKHISLAALKAANPGVDSTKLKIGNHLTIPAPTLSTTSSGSTSTSAAAADPGIYIVKSGDTLSKIAKAHGTTVKVIQSENNLATTVIKVGQKLKMPAKAEAVAPVVPEQTPAAPAPIVNNLTPPSTTSAH